MRIRKRKWTVNGQARFAWILVFKDNAGVWRQKTFMKKKEAEAFSFKLARQLSGGANVGAAKNLTIADLGQLWIDRAKAEGLERSTYEEYDRVLRIHIIPRIGSCKILEFDRAAVHDFRDTLLSDLGIVTAHRVFGYLKIIITLAEDRQWIANNPTKGITVKLSGRHRKRVEIFPQDEINGALNGAKRLGNRHSAFMHLFFFAALRCSEGRGLPWKCLDLERGLIAISQRADRWGVIGAVKICV